MSPRDRDDRQTRRVRLHASCAFGPTEDTPRSGTVTSLSTRGCFVKTRAWAESGNKMYLKIWREAGRGWLSLHATVLYHMEKVGFGVTFDDVTEELEDSIWAVMEEAKAAGALESGGEE